MADMEIYRYIFIGGLILAFVMLAASALIFFLLDIRKAFEVVFGVNRKRSISNLQKEDKKGSKPEAVTAAPSPAEESTTVLTNDATTKLALFPEHDARPSNETVPVNQALQCAIPGGTGVALLTETTFVHAGEVIA